MHWPSGEGSEIGIIEGKPAVLLKLARAKSTGKAWLGRTHSIVDSGARGLVFDGILIKGKAIGPVCLSEDPEIGEGVLSIVVDQAQDPVPVIAVMRTIFGDRVHPNSADG